MTKITVDSSMLEQFSNRVQEAELCDASGHQLGYYLPSEVYRRLVCRWANSQTTDEELARARNETESFTTPEVLAHLRSL